MKTSRLMASCLVAVVALFVSAAYAQQLGPAPLILSGSEKAPLPVLPERSDFADLKDVDKVPYLKYFGRSSYKLFLNKVMPRAFALSEEGAYGWAYGDNAVATALAQCNRVQKGQCRLYAIDDYVVWRERPVPAGELTPRPSAGGP